LIPRSTVIRDTRSRRAASSIVRNDGSCRLATALARLCVVAASSVRTACTTSDETVQRRRSDQTLAAVSEALGWPSGYLRAVADGRDPDDPDAGDPVLAELHELKQAVTAIRSRLDAIEQRLADDDGQQ
jgi:hypothetical protein